MVSALRILKANEQFNFQKKGYYYNCETALPIAPDGYLLPFAYPFAPVSGPYSYGITSFYLEEVDRRGNVLNTYTLSSSYINVVNNGSFFVMIYNCNENIMSHLTEYNDGNYRFRMVDSRGRTFYSEIFIINSFSYITIVGQGDFDPSDFNNDFLIS